MDNLHQRGRPRSPDSILIAIKAICLEAVHRNRMKDPDSKEILQRILASYHHGTKFAQDIYIKKIKEIDAILRGETSK